MLVLTRRIGESLMIGSRVTVTVVAVKGGQIRIGVNAPKSIPVHREELYERIRREQRRLGEPRTRPLSALERT
ncbi:MAG: carbon storage regulator CsrA [Deltaproteobacteria bacterium]|nr:MAG: carbon storage regulator CsrA [Deltaproteobacteria bacterium]